MATTVLTFSTAGSSTWVCPPGVTSIKAECVAGGGAGGQRSTTGGGGGGGGGEYAAEPTLAVTPGNSYTIMIGAAGVTAGASGGNSVFPGDAVTVTAHGGATVAANTLTGGTGGTGSTNTTHFNGGAGKTAPGTGTGDTGGGGGGSGGSASVGTTATTQTGAAAVTGGGPGGNGSTTSNGAGSPPASGPGGGGGGADRTSTGTLAGGAGFAGRVTLTFTTPLLASFTDTFPGSTLRPQWSLVLGSTTVSGNRCAIPITTSYAQIASVATYDCTNGSFFAKCDATAAVLADLEEGVYLSTVQAGFQGSANGFQLACVDGTLEAEIDTAGTVTQVGSSIAYNATTMKWLRIRLSGTSVFYDYGPDGLGWTNLASTTFAFTDTAMFTGFFTGYDAAEAAANMFISWVDVPPYSPPSVISFVPQIRASTW